jgi:hypothetical protein
MAVVPIGRFVQDIEVISLVPDGRSGGWVKVSIRGETAHDRDGLGAPAIGLSWGVDGHTLTGITGDKNERPQYEKPAEDLDYFVAPLNCGSETKGIRQRPLTPGMP